jgi:4-amino-4-deoxy-L-arabinose transferase-like glycosyltransferase
MLMLKAPPRRGGVAELFNRLVPPVSVPRYWAAAAFGACAFFAGGVAVFSSNSLHRLWGLIAACAYVAAAAGVLAWRKRGADLGLALSVGGALIAPLFLNAASGRHQPEVAVIAKSARLLVHHHSPYSSAAALAAAHNPNAYNPYLPVMIVFGIPRALFGSHVITDPRVWFGIAFLIIFWLALRAAGARHAGRWTVFVAATPVIAFELAVGGTDVPILALMCLGFALLWRRPHFVLAGIALGLASAAKATAWPAVVVASVLVGVRDGRRPTLAFLGSALASCLLIVGPVAAVWPGALLDNTIKFPLGLASMPSAAASPLPGHVMADTGAAGHLIAVGLLVLAGIAIAASLVIRPPRTVPGAVWRLIIGLTLMFTLAPATRYGYFIYPLALLMWLAISQLGKRQSDAEAEARARGEPGEQVVSAASPA